jgi:hypothetical protein
MKLGGMNGKFQAIKNSCHVDCCLVAGSESFVSRWRFESRLFVFSGKNFVVFV